MDYREACDKHGSGDRVLMKTRYDSVYLTRTLTRDVCIYHVRYCNRHIITFYPGGSFVIDTRRLNNKRTLQTSTCRGIINTYLPNHVRVLPSPGGPWRRPFGRLHIPTSRDANGDLLFEEREYFDGIAFAVKMTARRARQQVMTQGRIRRMRE